MSIELKSISSGYDELVLKDLHFSIHKGSFTVLLGPNGCGKSTLLKTIARVLTAKSGKIEIEGRNILKEDAKKVARTISFLPQSPIIPSGINIEQLVGYGRAPYQSLLGIRSQHDQDMIEKALSATALTALRQRPVTELSGGQRQRAFIAMSLAQDTPYMMLDEPTTFLDIKYQYETLDLLKSFHSQGRTIVVVLHDLAQAARYGDHLAIMKDGCIFAAGPPQTVMNTATIQDVFGLECKVFPDPCTGTPIISPVPS